VEVVRVDLAVVGLSVALKITPTWPGRAPASASRVFMDEGSCDNREAERGV
jgi:hypothetical protein